MNFLKKFIITLVSLFFMGIFSFGIMIWQSPWLQMFDDGPFVGEHANISDDRIPAESFTFSSFRLEAFEKKPEDKAPIVRLVEDGKTLWCIYATAYEHADVHSIKFFKSRSLFSHKIQGGVHWTYGHERSLWEIDRNGELKGYSYSW